MAELSTGSTGRPVASTSPRRKRGWRNLPFFSKTTNVMPPATASISSATLPLSDEFEQVTLQSHQQQQQQQQAHFDRLSGSLPPLASAEDSTSASTQASGSAPGACTVVERTLSDTSRNGNSSVRRAPMLAHIPRLTVESASFDEPNMDSGDEAPKFTTTTIDVNVDELTAIPEHGFESPMQQRCRQSCSPAAGTGGAAALSLPVAAVHIGSMQRHFTGSGSAPSTTAAGQTGATAVGSGATQPSSGMTRFPLWKLKPKSLQSTQSSSSDSAWRSMESTHMIWRSTEGVELTLRGTHLEYLSELERATLAKIAYQRLQRAQLGVSFSRPKDKASLQLKKKGPRLMRGTRSNTVTVIEKKSSGGQNHPQQVFGIPLAQCIANDTEMRCKSLDLHSEQAAAAAGHQTAGACPSSASATGTATSSGSLLAVPMCRSQLSPRMSTVSTLSGRSDSTDRSVSPVPAYLWAGSRQSSTTSQYSQDSDLSGGRNQSAENLVTSQSQLVPPHSALAQTASQASTSSHPPAQARGGVGGGSVIGMRGTFHLLRPPLREQKSYEPRNPQVPRIVETCTDYLKRRGLDTVGLFRIAGSKRRCTEMRRELDAGAEVPLGIVDDECGGGGSEIYQPHDIATLLKEYLLALPNPLGTKELYNVFMAIGRMSEEERRVELIRLAIILLPTANTDTLLVLLNFLQDVASHAEDRVGPDGNMITGNKMNTDNLARIFAPSIFGKEAAMLEDNSAAVVTVGTMIDNIDNIFTIPREMQANLYQNLHETDPDGLDHILYFLHQQMSMQDARGETAPGDEAPSLFCAIEERDFPEEITQEADGSTLVRQRAEVTHRIVYRPPRRRFPSHGQQTTVTSTSTAATAGEDTLLEEMTASTSRLELADDATDTSPNMQSLRTADVDRRRSSTALQAAKKAAAAAAASGTSATAESSSPGASPLQRHGDPRKCTSESELRNTPFVANSGGGKRPSKRASNKRQNSKKARRQTRSPTRGVDDYPYSESSYVAGTGSGAHTTPGYSSTGGDDSTDSGVLRRPRRRSKKGQNHTEQRGGGDAARAESSHEQPQEQRQQQTLSAPRPVQSARQDSSPRALRMLGNLTDRITARFGHRISNPFSQ